MLIKEKQTRTRLNIAGLLLAIWMAFNTGFVFAANGLEVLDRERDQSQIRQKPLSRPKMQIQDEKDIPEQKGTAEFKLDSLSISGATVFTEKELLKPYETLYGKTVSFNQLRQVAAELTRKYREAGYMLSRVVIPAQEVDERHAVIQLVAVEGYLSSIEYTGNPDILKRFRPYFANAQARLLASRPLHHGEFERELLLASDLPGIKVASTFRKSDIPGATVLVLDVQGEQISGNFSLGNTATNSSGPTIGTVSIDLNTLPVIGAKTTLAYSQAWNRREYRSWSLAESYQMANGLKLMASYAYSDSPEMDTRFARQFDYETNSHTFNLGISYPFVRSRDMNLSAGVNYEHRNSESFIASEHYTEDKLRSVSTLVNFDFSDVYGGVTQIIPTLSRGLKVFGATDREANASNPLADADFWKFDVYLSRDQQLWANFSLFAALEAQLSSSPLSSYNRFSLGGNRFGRGYDPGVLEGDSGLAAVLEPRWNWYPGSSGMLQLFTFVDWGNVRMKQHMAGIRQTENLSSAGAGIRFYGQGDRWIKNYNLSLFVGKALESAGDDDGGKPRLVLQGSVWF